MLNILRCFEQRKLRDWDLYLPQVAGALRATANRQTGYTANELMLGREVHKPADLIYGVASANQEHRTEDEHVKHMSHIMREVSRTARECLQRTQKRQKRDYDDAGLHETLYKNGDLVYLRDERTKIGLSKKLHAFYAGPYLVTKVLSPILYRIKGRRRELVVHHDRLIPCIARHIPLWMRKMRHEHLDLDETIGYDEVEQESDAEMVPDLTPLFDRKPAETPAEATTDPPSSDTTAEVTVAAKTAPSSNDQDTEDSAEPQYTRAGRLVKKNRNLRDYVVD